MQHQYNNQYNQHHQQHNQYTNQHNNHNAQHYQHQQHHSPHNNNHYNQHNKLHSQQHQQHNHQHNSNNIHNQHTQPPPLPPQENQLTHLSQIATPQTPQHVTQNHVTPQAPPRASSFFNQTPTQYTTYPPQPSQGSHLPPKQMPPQGPQLQYAPTQQAPQLPPQQTSPYSTQSTVAQNPLQQASPYQSISQAPPQLPPQQTSSYSTQYAVAQSPSQQAPQLPPQQASQQQASPYQSISQAPPQLPPQQTSSYSTQYTVAQSLAPQLPPQQASPYQSISPAPQFPPQQTSSHSTQYAVAQSPSQQAPPQLPPQQASPYQGSSQAPPQLPPPQTSPYSTQYTVAQSPSQQATQLPPQQQAPPQLPPQQTSNSPYSGQYSRFPQQAAPQLPPQQASSPWSPFSTTPTPQSSSQYTSPFSTTTQSSSQQASPFSTTKTQSSSQQASPFSTTTTTTQSSSQQASPFSTTSASSFPPNTPTYQTPSQHASPFSTTISHAVPTVQYVSPLPPLPSSQGVQLEFPQSEPANDTTQQSNSLSPLSRRSSAATSPSLQLPSQSSSVSPITRRSSTATPSSLQIPLPQMQSLSLSTVPSSQVPTTQTSSSSSITRRSSATPSSSPRLPEKTPSDQKSTLSTSAKKTASETPFVPHSVSYSPSCFPFQQAMLPQQVSLYDREFPDSLLGIPVVINSLAYPNFWLSASKISKSLTCDKNAAVYTSSATQWIISKSSNEYPTRYNLTSVAFPGFFMCLDSSKNIRLAMTSIDDQKQWSITRNPNRTYCFAPKGSMQQHLTIGDGKKKYAKLLTGAAGLKSSFYITPVSKLYKLPKMDFDKTVNTLVGAMPNKANTNSDWLSYLPDDVSLSQLWIPAAHDAGAFSAADTAVVGVLVDFMARTQTYSIPYQLQVGIRCLDIRLRHAKDSLYLHHGNIFLNDTWEGVLKKCVEFLEKNPSEFVILKVQQEWNSEGNTLTRWGSLVLQQLHCIPGRFVYASKKMPTLGEVRGKIVLTAWNPACKPGLQDLGFIPWGGLSKYDEGRLIQDDYDGPKAIVKWEKMMQVWDNAARASSNPGNYFFVNHTSATSFRGKGPKDWAKTMHQKLLPVLLVGSHAPQIILMDFPSAELIHFIIARNFIAPEFIDF
eukprot:TRINITY_DN1996_c0_g1_i1.p1 TRINITY_DN1996_c0_g1~~TRINITY_DN1996_c0_g1_i1.p1  ORF type:complete len:1129 (-),score=197.07 TRINITY_DN1996_c0_g1_i1:19-3405(-)